MQTFQDQSHQAKQDTQIYNFRNPKAAKTLLEHETKV